jgi:hypothetical protein
MSWTWLGKTKPDSEARARRPRLAKAALRGLLATSLYIFGIVAVAPYWCGRQARAWYNGEYDYQQRLARGVAEWMDNELTQDAFATGHRLFDSEWLFGTYMMSGMGLGQVLAEHGQEREWYRAQMRTAIDRLLSDEVRSFDRQQWGEDPLDSLGGDKGHAAYLGYANLLLGWYRLLFPDSEYKDVHDRISHALARRLEQSELMLLETYPMEVYPVDNCAVIASVALHSQATGEDYGDLIPRWAAVCRDRWIDAKTGLLIQCVDPATGAPGDLPRGSGTCLGAYMLSFGLPELAAELNAAVKRELAGTLIGFGGVREYPRGISGEYGDIDSGPIVFGFGLSSTGFAISGARISRDREMFGKLFRTAYASGAPTLTGERMHFVTGGALGDAIMLAMLTAPPQPHVPQLVSASKTERPSEKAVTHTGENRQGE